MSFWDDAWNGIKAVANVVTGGVTGAIDSAVTGIGNAMNTAGGAAAVNLAGGMMTGASAEQLQRQANEANAAEAEKNRQFQQSAQQQAQGFNAQQAATDRAFQAQQTQAARDYETSMSNSAYQRATADMRAAGINPMLAIMQGGASTPNVGAPSGASASSPGVSGAQAHYQAPIAGQEIIARKISEAVSSSFQYRSMAKELEMKDSNIKLNQELMNTQKSIQLQNMANAKVIGLKGIALKSQLPAIKAAAKTEKSGAEIEGNPWIQWPAKIFGTLGGGGNFLGRAAAFGASFWK